MKGGGIDEISKEETSQREGNAKEKPKFDTLDIESAANFHGHRKAAGDWGTILALAFQSLGVVYGDIGTSPLYVYSSIFPDGINHEDDILGILSLIIYTVTLIPLLKYVFVVLRANDNGEGGTFAMYSLICRYAKVGFIPSQEAADRDVSTYKLEKFNHRTKRASKIKSLLEHSGFAKYFLLLATMVGTSMLIGDGVLTPCISVLSAVGGIKEAAPSMAQDTIVWVSAVILVLLFCFQRFGTDKVGYSFAPIISVWFVFIGCIGIYNFFAYETSVIKALNPAYILYYFQRNKLNAWISLGGVILSTTGAEALFADVGHFSVKSIQISMCSVVYPSVILAYIGQASYLHKFPDNVSDTFYKSTPAPMYWPMFVVAVLAAIIASQALISGTFSIIQQSLSLGCFPRVKVIHTSAKYEGQVYIPEMNYLLMVACVAVTLGFRTTEKMGNAYGIAVVFVMTLTSTLLMLIMILVWKTSIFVVIAYALTIYVVELVYLSSVLYKFVEGGYLPLAFAFILTIIMYTWNFVYRRKYNYEQENKISPEKLKEVAADTNVRRLPGLAIFYSELVQGIPPIFKHYVDNVPALHSVLVFVSIKSLPLSRVPEEERFLFRRIVANDFNVLRCIVRYGYTDVGHEKEPFEKILFDRMRDYIRDEAIFSASRQEHDKRDQDSDSESSVESESSNDVVEYRQHGTIEQEIGELEKAWHANIVHFMGEEEVVASPGSNIVKRTLINYGYNFLKNNLRQTNKVFDIPHKRMLKVGMVYEL